MPKSQMIDNSIYDLPFLVEDVKENEIILKTKPKANLSKKDRENFKNNQVTVKVHVFNEEDIKELENVKNPTTEDSYLSGFFRKLFNGFKN